MEQANWQIILTEKVFSYNIIWFSKSKVSLSETLCIYVSFNCQDEGQMVSICTTFLYICVYLYHINNTMDKAWGQFVDFVTQRFCITEVWRTWSLNCGFKYDSEDLHPGTYIFAFTMHQLFIFTWKTSERTKMWKTTQVDYAASFSDFMDMFEYILPFYCDTFACLVDIYNTCDLSNVYLLDIDFLDWYFPRMYYIQDSTLDIDSLYALHGCYNIFLGLFASHLCISTILCCQWLISWKDWAWF